MAKNGPKEKIITLVTYHVLGTVHHLIIVFGTHTVFTPKSAYARKSASHKLAPPVGREIFNECLLQMSAPLFSQRGAHLKNSI